MNRILILLAMLVVGNVYAEVGDKYLCTVLKEAEVTLADYRDWPEATTKTIEDEDNLHQFYFLDQRDHETMFVKEMKIFDGRFHSYLPYFLEIQNNEENLEVTKKIKASESSGGAKHSIYLDKKTGNFLFEEFREWPRRYKFHTAKCQKIDAKSLEDIELDLAGREWPKFKMTEENLLCNADTLHLVHVEFLGGHERTDAFYRTGAHSQQTWEMFLSNQDDYVEKIDDALRFHLRPAFEVVKRENYLSAGDPSVMGKVWGGFFCNLWTVSGPADTVALNVTCQFIFRYREDSMHGYKFFSDDMSVENMIVISQSQLKSVVPDFLRRTTERSVLHLYQKKSEYCENRLH